MNSKEDGRSLTKEAQGFQPRLATHHLVNTPILTKYKTTPVEIHQEVSKKCYNVSFKAVTYLLLAILAQLSSLVKAGSCGTREMNPATAWGSVIAKRFNVNNTMQTIDHYAIYRVLDLASSSVIYELDLKPELSAIPAPTTPEAFESIRFAILRSETEATIYSRNKIYQ